MKHLNVGQRLVGPDNGFGEKRGMVVRANHHVGDYRIKWQDIDRSLIYDHHELAGMVRNGYIVVL